MNLKTLMDACPNLVVIPVGYKPKPKYYIEKTGPDRYDMRQERYRAQRTAGKEHPHDTMAIGFTAVGMRELISKYFDRAEVDTAAIDQ